MISLFRRASLFGAASALLIAGVASAQEPASVVKLPLKAGIVLTPNFCATKKRQSVAIMDVLKIGKGVCEQLYPALDALFSGLERFDKAPSAPNTGPQLILIPRFLEISATAAPFLPTSQRNVVILLEWTIQDPSGNTIWLQTVKGSSEHRAGWMVTTKSMAALVDPAIEELVKESVARISSAPELRKFAH